MDTVNKNKIIKFIESAIDEFHETRLSKLSELKLKDILKRKNPYLFKAKNLSVSGLIQSILDAYLSSQEEAIFGTFLEKLAIFVSSIFINGKKSSAQGVDLEFQRKGKHYIVSIKSGPNWGNSSSINKMVDYFNKAKKILKSNSNAKEIIAICGCCYGRDDNPIKEQGYIKLCGKRFWEFITGEENFYVDIIEPIGHKAKEKNEKYISEYNKIVNRLTKEFLKDFSDEQGNILWDKIVILNSDIIKNTKLPI